MENLTKKVRSKKLNPRVDLTAMVSISFLLIIFFMVNNELTKPKNLSLSLPEKDPIWDGVISCGSGIDNRIITLLLDENNKIIFYRGLLNYPEYMPKEVKYGHNGIHKVLMTENKKIRDISLKYGKTNRGAIVIIKPTKKSSYGNLIDILDEMQINGIETYTIVNEYSPEERKLLNEKSFSN
jgi:biopolymer transport protein ExbD